MVPLVGLGTITALAHPKFVSYRLLSSMSALVLALGCSDVPNTGCAMREGDRCDSEGPDPEGTTDASDGGVSPELSAEIGVPGGPDGLDFAPLEAGTELRLQTLGQGGTHLFFAIRTVGFGNRAFVTVKMRNLVSGKEIQSPAPPRPQLLFCDDAQVVCDLVPLTVMTGGITDSDEERDGLHVAIEAEVHNEAGAQAFASNEAVLSTADL